MALTRSMPPRPSWIVPGVHQRRVQRLRRSGILAGDIGENTARRTLVADQREVLPPAAAAGVERVVAAAADHHYRAVGRDDGVVACLAIEVLAIVAALGPGSSPAPDVVAPVVAGDVVQARGPDQHVLARGARQVDVVEGARFDDHGDDARGPRRRWCPRPCRRSGRSPGPRKAPSRSPRRWRRRPRPGCRSRSRTGCRR